MTSGSNAGIHWLMTTFEASQLIGCSKNHIVACIADGTLKASERKLKKRIVWEIDDDSVIKYAKKSKNNKRIGRPLLCREVNRKPIKSKGYTYIYEPKHKLANKDGYVAEHVLIMEQSLQRKLKKGECVHHINRQRSDNRFANLVLFSSKGEHMKSEHSELMGLVLRIRNNYKLEKQAIKFMKDLLKTSAGVI